MKSRRPHRKPLSEAAVAILKDLHRLTGHHPLVLPSVKSSRQPISENGFNQALRRMGFEKGVMTSHGFRAVASSLLNESGRWNPDAIERELSHIEANEVRRAYARGEHWAERVEMSAWWAHELERLKGPID